MSTSPNRSESTALIVGSSPSAPICSAWDIPHVIKIGLNNAWRLRPDFDYSFYPGDFPEQRRPPPDLPLRQVSIDQYLPFLENAGGRVFVGPTVAFASGYWAVAALKPAVLAYVGCDMTYDQTADGKTHFYGQGKADPLRANVALRSLEAKSCRLLLKALVDGVLIVNVSKQPATRLSFPRAGHELLGDSKRGAALRDAVLKLPVMKELKQAVLQIEEKEQRSSFAQCRPGKIVPTDEVLTLIDALDQEWLRLHAYVDAVKYTEAVEKETL